MGSVSMDSSTANQTYLEKTFHKVLWGKTWICQALAPTDTDSQESACNVEDSGPISGLRRPLGEGRSYPLHYSYLENPMDRGAWRATVHGDAKQLDTTEQQHHP